MNILLVLSIIHFVHSQDITPLVDTKILSELPLEKLLEVRSSFQEIDDNPDDQPQALPLHGKIKPNERGGYQEHHYVEEYSKKSGKKSIQSIFQLSVTTLAFLAFGGYLLCLLFQAIKSKDMMNDGGMNMMMNTQTMAAIINAVNKRKRPTRRPPNRFQSYQRPGVISNKRKPLNRPKRDVWTEADPEDMYYTLLSLSEAYTNYHTIDYRRFNYTANRYH